MRVNATVLMIALSYEASEMLQGLTSYNSATSSSSTDIVNDILYGNGVHRDRL